MPCDETPEFSISEVPIFIGPEALARLFELPVSVANQMLNEGTVKTYDVGPSGVKAKRTTLKECIDYFNHVT